MSRRPVASVLEARQGIVGILPPPNGFSCPLGDIPLSGGISGASSTAIPQQDWWNKFKHTETSAVWCDTFCTFYLLHFYV